MAFLKSDMATTLVTLGIAALGACLGWLVSAPVYPLLGPALLVSMAGLAGMRTGIHDWLRDACFIVLGLAVGSGFDPQVLEAMARWPMAFVGIVGLVLLLMLLGQGLLHRFFGFDRRSALMASTPGHLSFVLAIATDTGGDVLRISVTQSVRLLSLTLIVPFIALLLGLDLSGPILLDGPRMPMLVVLGLMVGALLLGLLFQRLSVPAPLLMGAMVLSGAAHLSNLTPGTMPLDLALPAYVVLGALIGTRFSAMSWDVLKTGLGAGLANTALAVGLGAFLALPVAAFLEMPVGHVLIGFAPGGLETMIAMGVVLGAAPGFVAACHMLRLIVLSIAVPILIARLNKGVA